MNTLSSLLAVAARTIGHSYFYVLIYISSYLYSFMYRAKLTIIGLSSGLCLLSEEARTYHGRRAVFLLY